MTCFSKIFEKSDEFISLSRSITPYGAPVGATGLSGVSKAAVIHALCEKLNKTAFIIMPDEAGAVRMFENLSAENIPPWLLPRAQQFSLPCRPMR